LPRRAFKNDEARRAFKPCANFPHYCYLAKQVLGSGGGYSLGRESRSDIVTLTPRADTTILKESL
jgi:hypothetical protein